MIEGIVCVYKGITSNWKSDQIRIQLLNYLCSFMDGVPESEILSHTPKDIFDL